MKLYSLWCEWDLGQEYIIFSSQEKGREWLAKEIAQDEYLSDEYDVDRIFNLGLAGFTVVALYD